MLTLTLPESFPSLFIYAIASPSYIHPLSSFAFTCQYHQYPPFPTNHYLPQPITKTKSKTNMSAYTEGKLQVKLYISESANKLKQITPSLFPTGKTFVDIIGKHVHSYLAGIIKEKDLDKLFCETTLYSGTLLC